MRHESSKYPAVSFKAVDVAETCVPPIVDGVNEYIDAPEDAQGEPTLEIVPAALNVAQPEEPPALDTVRFVVLAEVAVIAVVEA